MNDDNNDPDKKESDDMSSDWDVNETTQDGKKGVADTLKKLFTVGLGAAFMTEESIRTYLGELKLPKEALNFVLQGAKKSKEELMNRVGNEIVAIIRKIDFVEEASRFVETHKFKISAEVEVLKKNVDSKDAGKER